MFSVVNFEMHANHIFNINMDCTHNQSVQHGSYILMFLCVRVHCAR